MNMRTKSEIIPLRMVNKRPSNISFRERSPLVFVSETYVEDP